MAFYRNVVVLDNNERMQAEQFFQNQLAEIRDYLENMDENVNVIHHFDNQPLSNVVSGYVCPKINIKYLIEDETYLFDDNKTFTPSRGWYHYKALYSK